MKFFAQVFAHLVCGDHVGGVPPGRLWRFVSALAGVVDVCTCGWMNVCVWLTHFVGESLWCHRFCSSSVQR